LARGRGGEWNSLSPSKGFNIFWVLPVPELVEGVEGTT